MPLSSSGARVADTPSTLYDLTLAPYPVAAPDGARPMGDAPFLDPGEVVHWHYRTPGWQEGDPEIAAPMRVVRDDERGLVAWLAAGTTCLTWAWADGGAPRSVPLEERWTGQHRRVRAMSRWRGNGILRIAPAGQPWSVWLFWEPGDADSEGPADWEFAGWYVNLENAHLRSGAETFTGDHVLDLWIEADGTIHVKDDDELDAAVTQGRGTTQQAAMIRHNAELARAAYGTREWYFDEAWTLWRPDPATHRAIRNAAAY